MSIASGCRSTATRDRFIAGMEPAEFRQDRSYNYFLGAPLEDGIYRDVYGEITEAELVDMLDDRTPTEIRVVAADGSHRAVPVCLFAYELLRQIHGGCPRDALRMGYAPNRGTCRRIKRAWQHWYRTGNGDRSDFIAIGE